MRSRPPEGSVFAVLLGALLIVGLFSLRLIPVYEPLWGLDFQNVYAFQNCPEAREFGPYSVSGEICGDELNRAFSYPPALFHAFFWAERFTLDEATLIWNAIMVVLMLFSGMIWWRLDRQNHSGWRSVALVALWLLLMAQFPFAFALERGNNDVILVALWSGAVALFVGRRVAFSGGFAGLAAALKVYPVVAAATVVIGLLRGHSKTLALFIAGGIGGTLLASVFWLDETMKYFTEILPALANRMPTLRFFNHTLLGLGVHTVVVVGIAVTLFGSWAAAAWRRLHQEPLLVFGGALAISTYFSSISFDYNLITAYPLLLLVTGRALAPRSSSWWKVAAFGVILAIIAGRGMFTPAGQLLAQIGALVGIAWLVILDNGTRDPQSAANSNRAATRWNR